MDLHSKFTYSPCPFTSFSSSFTNDAVFEHYCFLLLHYFLTSTQNADTTSLSSYFTNGHHHPSSLIHRHPSSLIHCHFAALAPIVTSVGTGLHYRHFWSSLLNCSQVVFLQSTSSQNWPFFFAAATTPPSLQLSTDLRLSHLTGLWSLRTKLYLVANCKL